MEDKAQRPRFLTCCPGRLWGWLVGGTRVHSSPLGRHVPREETSVGNHRPDLGNHACEWRGLKTAISPLERV